MIIWMRLVSMKDRTSEEIERLVGVDRNVTH